MEKETNEMETGKEPPEDKAIFVPFEEIKRIEQVINNLEVTRRELQKVAEGMRRVES